MTEKKFTVQLLEWYRVNKRDLPWRKTNDPYRIWLSEVLLQQTRVSQGLPYYRKFISRFPRIYDLAKAPESTVLRLWQGLGYYSRARNLLRCAREIVKKYNGDFPSDIKELKKLPGIGDYSAAAISSIAFGQRTAVVDGNVFRVLARVFGIEKEITLQGGKKEFANLANRLIPANNPGIFNQALMEFGALYCVPNNPNCTACIFKTGCFAYSTHRQGQLPVKHKKIKIRIRKFHYYILIKDGKIWMSKRTNNDIWRGLFEFYLVEQIGRKVINRIFPRIRPFSLITHQLTHQRIHVSFYLQRLRNKELKRLETELESGKFYSTKEIARIPKPILIDRIMQETDFSQFDEEINTFGNINH